VESGYWNRVAASMEGSYHLDPAMAERKRAVHLDLLRRWCPSPTGRVLKTDLFEEAFEKDRILPDWPGPEGEEPVYGVDIAPRIAGTAARRLARSPRPVRVAAADALHLPFRDGAFDLVYGCSTLDHFADRRDLLRGLDETARVVRPGGFLVMVLDNPEARFHPLVRFLGRFGLFRFRLGETLSVDRLAGELERLGLETLDRRHIFHVPRVWASAAFRILRALRLPAERILGGRLDRMERKGAAGKGRRTGWYGAVLARRPGGGSDREEDGR